LIGDIHLDLERSDRKSSPSGAVGAKQEDRLVFAAARASESANVLIDFWLVRLSFKQLTICCSHLLDRRSDNRYEFRAFICYADQAGEVDLPTTQQMNVMT